MQALFRDRTSTLPDGDQDLTCLYRPVDDALTWENYRTATPVKLPANFCASRLSTAQSVCASPLMHGTGERDRERGQNDGAHSSESVLENRLWPKT
jgi:hypothetical protein